MFLIRHSSPLCLRPGTSGSEPGPQHRVSPPHPEPSPGVGCSRNGTGGTQGHDGGRRRRVLKRDVGQLVFETRWSRSRRLTLFPTEDPPSVPAPRILPSRMRPERQPCGAEESNGLLYMIINKQPNKHLLCKLKHFFPESQNRRVVLRRGRLELNGN